MISIPQILLPFALAGLGLAPAADSGEETHPMAGKWQFNEEQSEDPRDKMRAARRGGGRGGPGRGGGQGGLGRGGGQGAFGGGGQQQGQTATRGRRPRGERGGQGGGPGGPALELAITVSDESFVVTGGERPEQIYTLGDELADGVAMQDGDGFVVQAETPRGDVVTRKFSLAKKGQRLRIKTTLPGRDGGDGIQFTTVYDRVTDE